MISDEENPAPTDEAAPEERNLLERSSAPTVLDLRAALKDLFKTVEEEPDSTPPNDSLPRRRD
jgi:hypothetical protein